MASPFPVFSCAPMTSSEGSLIRRDILLPLPALVLRLTRAWSLRRASRGDSWSSGRNANDCRERDLWPGCACGGRLHDLAPCRPTGWSLRWNTAGNQSRASLAISPELGGCPVARFRRLLRCVRSAKRYDERWETIAELPPRTSREISGTTALQKMEGLVRNVGPRGSRSIMRLGTVAARPAPRQEMGRRRSSTFGK